MCGKKRIDVVQKEIVVLEKAQIDDVGGNGGAEKAFPAGLTFAVGRKRSQCRAEDIIEHDRTEKHRREVDVPERHESQGGDKQKPVGPSGGRILMN